MNDARLKQIKLEANGHLIRVGEIQHRYEIGRILGRKQIVPIYDHKIHDWLGEKAKELVINKFDCPILIVGKRRRGKSLNGACIARKIDPDFPLERVAFRLDGFREMLNQLPRADPEKEVWPVAIYDEAGVDLYSKDWQRRFVKEMVKVFQIIGKKRITMIFCLPHRNLLVGDLRESMEYWIAVKTVDHKRGFAELREASENENIWQLKSYWKPLCGFNFEEVPDRWWTEYEKAKDDFIDDYCSREDEPDSSRAGKLARQRDALLKLVCSQPEHPKQEELADLLDINRTTLSHILNPPTPSFPPTPTYSKKNNRNPHIRTSEPEDEED